MNELSERMAQDARLLILQELARQNDARLNEMTLTQVLDTMGIYRSRDWVRSQLRALADLDAVKVVEVGTVMVATLTRVGRDHVERRALLSGISRPGDV
jgi:hypothetical protein